MRMGGNSHIPHDFHTRFTVAISMWILCGPNIYYLSSIKMLQTFSLDHADMFINRYKHTIINIFTLIDQSPLLPQVAINYKSYPFHAISLLALEMHFLSQCFLQQQIYTTSGTAIKGSTSSSLSFCESLIGRNGHKTPPDYSLIALINQQLAVVLYIVALMYVGYQIFNIRFVLHIVILVYMGRNNVQMMLANDQSSESLDQGLPWICEKRIAQIKILRDGGTWVQDCTGC